MVAVGIEGRGKRFTLSGHLSVLVEPVGLVGYFFLQFTGSFAVADVVVGINKDFSPADAVFNQLAAAVVGKIPYCDRCPRIPGIPLLDGTYQGVVLVFMAGRQFAVRPLSVTDGGYEVEPGMGSIATAQPKGSFLGHVTVSIIGEFPDTKVSLTEVICPRWL